MASKLGFRSHFYTTSFIFITQNHRVAMDTKIIIKNLFLLITFFIFYIPTKGQDKFHIAFYNVENLFDTKDDPNIKDEEFMPNSEKQWTEERYKTKLANLAKVIANMNEEFAPDILGLCEIENKQVLDDLVKQNLLAYKNYKYVHYDSPDERGIDVALMYKETKFRVVSSQTYKVALPNKDDKTRDILRVSGVLSSKDTLHLLVAHFPSRSGGKEKSEPSRIAAAQTARKVIDSLLTASPKANIVMMGDLNDQPFDKSIWDELNAQPYSFDLKPEQLFNPMGVLEFEGKGSYCYRDDWNMIDHIIISRNLLDEKSKLRYKVASAMVFQKEYMKQSDDPKYKGYPLRTYAGNKYLGGFSDHLPVSIILER